MTRPDTISIPAEWTGSAFRPLGPAPCLPRGAVVTLDVQQDRTQAQHRQQFAWIRDAWESLPEAAAGKPWAASPDTLRKHALIVTGYAQAVSIAYETAAQAVEASQASIVTRAGRTHGYAIATVQGTSIILLTPESQSEAAMGRQRFLESKAAVLDWIAGLLGVDPDDLDHDHDHHQQQQEPLP